jgi:hypothetical protein
VLTAAALSLLTERYLCDRNPTSLLEWGRSGSLHHLSDSQKSQNAPEVCSHKNLNPRMEGVTPYFENAVGII